MKKPENTLFFVEGNPSFEDCDAAVLGVAFDENASYGRGAAEAPAAIMQASHQMETEIPLSGRTIQTAVHNFGIIKPKSAGEMLSETAAIAKKAIAAEKFFILIGGDHSTVNGLLDALPKETMFVNFDAHLDLREEWQGKKLSHAAVSRRVFDKGFEQIWVGARDGICEEEQEFVSEQGISEKIFYCPSMPRAFYSGKEFPKWMKEENMLFGNAWENQSEKILKLVGNRKVWLNIDIDCLDLRQGIETGVPTAFGLSLEQLNEMLFEICAKKEVLGFSLAEAIPDKKGKSQAIAAMLCFNILAWGRK
ncbi:MAG: arginase family protein [Candidatus Diapherotrites archaeon]|uniref:Arginase family protein n=1 Tax=Candidatus Iainarchaeum sp. TaxID=3101447 RepID=A0A938YW13_9ARCH|nr:arginase family protein [Candidatus Diapherotrites archaeon]